MRMIDAHCSDGVVGVGGARTMRMGWIYGIVHACASMRDNKLEYVLVMLRFVHMYTI